jgi:DNA-binding transcriptional MerR regulator
VRIGELSRLSGVSARSLRYYEQHGLITAERGTNGYREYGDDVVQAARNLHLLFELGVGRELARSVLACSGDAPAEVHRATRGQLIEVLDQMTQRLDELSTARTALAAIIDETR